VSEGAYVYITGHRDPELVAARHLLGSAGYSHFFTGEFIRKTGPAIRYPF